MWEIPQFFRVRQRFEAPRIDDVPAAVQAALEKLHLASRIRPGQSVAITAGSRGVANIHLIIRSIAQHFLSLGAKPFIVPAMGSHAGGTALGQQRLIESYGITEEFCGCPIRSSMETVVVARTKEGFPVHFDKHAFEADHVVVCNRIKPHTNFVGDIESGLCKMMLIGLGKHEGAKIYHRAIQDYSFPQILESVSREVLEKCRIAAGVAVVENGYDETAHIAALGPDAFEEGERRLLELARKYMPRLPFDRVDILILDEIGKNISGSGMDTNVVGRKFHDHKADVNEFPKVKRIIVRSLSEETHGNAAGIGIAEFCKSRVLEQMDRDSTVINCLTGGHPQGAMIPIYFDTDRELLEAALGNIGLVEPPQARLLWVRNTLQVAAVECSAAYLQEAREREDLDIVAPLRPLPLDSEGNLPSFVEYAAMRFPEATTHRSAG